MIACVIVTYNRIKTLKKTIEAVINQTRRPDVIIIVDNNSPESDMADNFYKSFPNL